MNIQTTVKKWGNSIGIIIPKEIVEMEKIKVNEKILINIIRKADLTNIFGSLKTSISGQEFKDMVRKGWK